MSPAGHEIVPHEFSRSEIPGDKDSDVDGEDPFHRTHATDHATGSAGVLHVIAIEDAQLVPLLQQPITSE